jgi:Zn finger protein HypA/HybF involved in hydrogenase expression
MLVSGRGASRPVVTARLDHRCCEKCGHEFTARSSLTAVRRSIVMVETRRAFWPCPKCGSQEAVVVSTDAFPSNRGQSGSNW